MASLAVCNDTVNLSSIGDVQLPTHLNAYTAQQLSDQIQHYTLEHGVSYAAFKDPTADKNS